MVEDDILRVRRAVMRLTERADGESVTITCGPSVVQQFTTEVLRFARIRKIGVACATVALGLQVTRCDANATVAGGRFAAMNSLAVGASHTFDIPPADHHKVRVAASVRGRTSDARFSCERVGDAIKVTRIPLDQERTFGRPRRRSIDLSPLNACNALAFEGLDCFNAVRNAAVAAQRRQGWDLHCKAPRGGTTITVYRLDNLEVKPGGVEVAAVLEGMAQAAL